MTGKPSNPMAGILAFFKTEPDGNYRNCWTSHPRQISIRAISSMSMSDHYKNISSQALYSRQLPVPSHIIDAPCIGLHSNSLPVNLRLNIDNAK